MTSRPAFDVVERHIDMLSPTKAAPKMWCRLFAGFGIFFQRRSKCVAQGVGVFDFFCLQLPHDGVICFGIA